MKIPWKKSKIDWKKTADKLEIGIRELRSVLGAKDDQIVELYERIGQLNERLKDATQPSLEQITSKNAELRSEIKEHKAIIQEYKQEKLRSAPLNEYEIIYTDGTYENVRAHYHLGGEFMVHGEQYPIFAVVDGSIKSIRNKGEVK